MNRMSQWTMMPQWQWMCFPINESGCFRLSGSESALACLLGFHFFWICPAWVWPSPRWTQCCSWQRFIEGAREAAHHHRVGVWRALPSSLAMDICVGGNLSAHFDFWEALGVWNISSVMSGLSEELLDRSKTSALGHNSHLVRISKHGKINGITNC